MLRLNEKLSEVQLLRLRATFHALPLIYLRTYIFLTYARKNYATLEINPKSLKNGSDGLRKEQLRPGGGGGGVNQPIFIRGGSTPRLNPFSPFMYHFLRKRAPFPVDKWHPFHIPCVELCILFNYCKCTAF